MKNKFSIFLAQLADGGWYEFGYWDIGAMIWKGIWQNWMLSLKISSGLKCVIQCRKESSLAKRDGK